MDFVSNDHSSSNISGRSYRLFLKLLSTKKIIHKLHAHRIDTVYIIKTNKSKQSMIQKCSMNHGIKSQLCMMIFVQSASGEETYTLKTSIHTSLKFIYLFYLFN